MEFFVSAVYRLRSVERGRDGAGSNPNPGSNKSPGISHKQKPTRDAGEAGLAKTARESTVRLLPLVSKDQLLECCQKNSLRFSPVVSDPAPAGTQGVHSTSLSGADELQCWSQLETDEPSVPQRRVKQRFRARDRPNKGAPLPRSLAEKETTGLQPTACSKLSRGRVELQKAFLDSDTDYTPRPLTRASRRVRKSRFKNPASDGSSLEAENPPSQPNSRRQARKQAGGRLAQAWVDRRDSGGDFSEEPQRALKASSRVRRGAVSRRTPIPAPWDHPHQRCMAESETHSGSAVLRSSHQRVGSSTDPDTSKEGHRGRIRPRAKSSSDLGSSAESSHSQDLVDSPEISALLKRPDTNRKVKYGDGRSPPAATARDSQSELSNIELSPEDCSRKKVTRLKRKGKQNRQQISPESPERNREVRKNMDKTKNENVKVAKQRKEDKEKVEDNDDAWTEKELEKLHK